MDYHKDRFDDHSLMIYEDETLVGIVPAHVKDNSFYSHRGLTYGIPVAMCDKHKIVYDAILDYLKVTAFAKAEFNLLPDFYNQDSDEILLSKLQASGFQKERVSNYLFVDLQEELDFSPKKTVGYRNGKFEGFQIERNHHFKPFWEEVLVPSLKVRHNSAPVHNLEEIELLAFRFPEKIIQHNLYRENELLAGITFFIKGTIIKSQYAASTPTGMKTDAVGFLYMEAMQEYKNLGFHHMDLGPVNENDGSINEGLLRFKKQLGGKMTEVKRLVKLYNRKNH